VDCALEAIEGVTLSAHDHFKRLVIFVLANFACRLVTPIILGAITVASHTGNLISSDFANTRGTAAIDLFLFFGFFSESGQSRDSEASGCKPLVLQE
jgi:hypothetical protein